MQFEVSNSTVKKTGLKSFSEAAGISGILDDSLRITELLGCSA